MTASRARVVMAAMLFALLIVIPALELASEGAVDGDDPHHMHTNLVLASACDLLPRVVPIMPRPDVEPAAPVFPPDRSLFIPPRR